GDCALFQVQAPTAFPITMQPMQRDVWHVTMQGNVLGHHECTVDLLDDDGNADFISLSGDIVAPIMTVQPVMIGFGDVAVGGEANQRISISNDGTAPLTISAITPG